MSWSFFHHVGFLCYPLLSSLSLPLLLSVTLSLLQDESDTAELLLHLSDIQDESHTSQTLSTSEKFFGFFLLFPPTPTPHGGRMVASNLWQTANANILSRCGQVRLHERWAAVIDISDTAYSSPLHPGSRLYKQADFNGVPVTLPWPAAKHAHTDTHTRWFFQPAASQRGWYCVLSICQSFAKDSAPRIGIWVWKGRISLPWQKHQHGHVHNLCVGQQLSASTLESN